MCNMDCFNCTKKDCNFCGVTDEEKKRQDKYDTEIRGFYAIGKARSRFDYNHSEKGEAAKKKYDESEKGKERKRRYNHSEKCKAAQKRYANSEKGKAAQRKSTQNKIASGKNAEYCRAYYQRKKAEREAQLCKV